MGRSFAVMSGEGKITRRKGEAPASANERDFPHIVEASLPKGGFDVRVSREMEAFHKKRAIGPRFGWSRHRNGAYYSRWCFASAALADEFCAEFGGVRLTNNRQASRRRRLKSVTR